MRRDRLAWGLGALGMTALACGVPACGGGGGSTDAGQDLVTDLGGDMPVDVGPDGTSPAMLTADETEYDYGTLPVDATTSRTFRITNEGGSTSSAIATSLSGDPVYSIGTDDCDGATLDPSESCDVTVVLAPTASGTPAATLSVVATSGGTVEIDLSATIVSASDLTIDPSPHLFDTTVIGASSTAQTFTVTNTGPVATTALTTAVTGSHNTQFVVSDDGCDGMVLAPNDTCMLDVTFTPSGSVSGMRAASLTVSATTGGTGTAALQGAALTPATLVVDDDAHDFLVQNAGTPSAMVTFTVTNTGGQTSGTLSPMVTGDTGDFDVLGNTCTGELAGLGSCAIDVIFDPLTFGAKTLSIVISGTPGGTIMITLTGTGRDWVAVDIVQPFGGTGTGSITGTGIDCPAMSCATWIERTTANPMLTLTATPGNASTFEGWGGACATAGTMPACTLTVAADAIVSATFNLTPAALVIDADAHGFDVVDVGSPTTARTFTISNTGGQASGTLSTMITGDTADFDVTANTCTGSLAGLDDCAISVRFDPATFGAKDLSIVIGGVPGGNVSIALDGTGRDYVALTVTQPFGGSGTGSVSGGGIACPSGTCTTQVPRTTANPMVTLTATPDVSSDFDGWGGACAFAGTTSTCSLTLSAAAIVSATFDIKTFTLTITRQNVGMASGSVTSVSMPTPPNEIDCGSNCMRTFDYGTMVTLTPAPTAGFYFGGWTGDCPAGEATCTLAMTQDRSAEASFSSANRAFVTTASYTVPTIKTFATDTSTEAAKMLSGADAICQTAGGSSTFRAWLASNSVNAITRLPATARGWLRADGRPFRDRLVASSPTYYPVTFDQNGADSGEELYWTGADSDGSGSNAASCGDWDTGSFAWMGARRGVGDRWTRHGQGFCAPSFSRRLLCLDTAYTAFIPPPAGPPAGARLAFASTAAFDPSTGIGAADAICASEASAASLPGTYRAFMATNGASPASRFTSRGDPVYRPDGLLAFATDTAMFMLNASPIAPIATTASRQETPALLVWIGAFDPTSAGTTASTCFEMTNGSWSTSSAGVNGALGNPYWANQWMAAANFPCNQTGRGLYCLEE